ncbi:hypothetical protein NJB1907f44_35640 [Mycobacterium marinum]|nr:hypothetical protein NJB1907E90_23920 [Mycobacterium marinum]GJO14448.1 hypothetical protein NJB1907f34b_50860 [Mycobacterium marinum]GJO26122.1 hypothetical protein NJB1907E11_41410 [Mycobacterium marinum]GJO29116.1 hypothetical protein NJB1728e18_42820 [Mycobacterium marinum]GJO33291.1 hypothetical protein NJB1907f22_34920 [Mycobacterium marinum]
MVAADKGIDRKVLHGKEFQQSLSQDDRAMMATGWPLPEVVPPRSHYQVRGK